MDMFEGTDTTTPVIDPNKQYAAELIGENAKYKTQEDAARALVEKDAFIEQLKREAKEARESLSKRTNEEEFLTRLEQLTKTKASPETQDQPAVEGVGTAPTVTLDDVDALLEKREAEKSRQANLKAVEDKLKATYGDLWRSKVQSQAQALGVSTAFLTDVAAKNASAFFRLVGLEGQTQPQTTQVAPPRSSSFAPTVTDKKNDAYYQKQREAKGESWYFSVPVQQERFKAAMEQGAEFFNS